MKSLYKVSLFWLIIMAWMMIHQLPYGYGAGAVVYQAKYEPFGEIISETGTLVGDVDYTFTGQEMDRDLKMLDYGARFYHSTLARFLSIDPIDQHGVGAYVYVNNNPLRYIDPTGCQYCEPQYSDCDDLTVPAEGDNTKNSAKADEKRRENQEKKEKEKKAKKEEKKAKKEEKEIRKIIRDTWRRAYYKYGGRESGMSLSEWIVHMVLVQGANIHGPYSIPLESINQNSPLNHKEALEGSIEILGNLFSQPSSDPNRPPGFANITLNRRNQIPSTGLTGGETVNQFLNRLRTTPRPK